MHLTLAAVLLLAAADPVAPAVDDAQIAKGLRNRNWLYARVQPGSDSAAALLELRTAEVQYMLMRLPVMRNLMIARLTAMEMQRPGATADGWGTPLRLDGTRIISAGADLEFDPESRAKPPALDLDEDIIVEGGAVTRNVDPIAYLRVATNFKLK